MSRQLTLQIHPGRGLGFIVLSKLKSQPSVFLSIDIYYSPADPLSEPVILNLPKNGFRLRFDGPGQRLRLIEVLDFSYTHFTYDGKDVVKLAPEGGATKGPAFRQIYDRLIGPTFPGEFAPPLSVADTNAGSYVLSYPGIAFTFPLRSPVGMNTRDFVSLLSSSQAGPAKSMALFDGESWSEARKDLYTRPSLNHRSWMVSNRARDLRPDEIDHVLLKGDGLLEFYRRNAHPFQILLSSTSPQDLITELGPPDAIYRKSDKRLAIHKSRRNRKSGKPVSVYEDTTDTDQSSHAVTDESAEEDECNSGVRGEADADIECFWNYFNHGVDVFLSYSSRPLTEPSQLVATKILLHGNIPGSYPFNRYRRCRWKLDQNLQGRNDEMTSETTFSTISSSLQEIHEKDPSSRDLLASFRQGMVLNRGWGNSPGSSCELLGGWEEGGKSAKVPLVGEDGPGLGNTELFGFPGMIFEVLKNDRVSCLTIY
ncbi:uncharacterized protein KY384_001807 [Bacidia gigantensis]|uniref:uncharacterized protein n=1 Tax=Bacidia gigantensis TaxID=2732470 RepID=UPI001D03EAA4|nr:uncharacterized protein KY384_001807 [Bacidia gigantensis]KAG8533024.1 hypothetical protein KY384_001807 [Bacidia gigantensis]